MDPTDQNESKPPNPKKEANFLSIITFWWMVPIFRKGYKTRLETSDLFETLDSHRSDKKGDMLETAWTVEKIRANKNKRNPNLTKVLIKVFGPSIMWYGLRFAFLELFVKMLQPIALGQLVLSYSSDNKENARTNIIVYSAILVTSSVVSTFICYPTLMATFHKSLKLKVACASLIYRKSLRLSKTALQTTTAGHIVNLLSADLNSLDLICYFCHNLWIGPLVTIIATVIMYNEVGVYALLGVFIILLTIPFQAWLSKFYAKLKRKGATKTDERLELMNEIIKGIQVIKMYTWEKPFSNIVSVIRRKEILMTKYALYIKGLHVAFTVFRTRTAIFASILAYVLSGNILTARKVFVMTACFNTMRHTMTDFFTFAIEQIVVAQVSIQRIEKFLMQEEVGSLLEYKDIYVNETTYNGNETKEKVEICMKNVSAKWNRHQMNNSLSNINLDVTSSGFVALIGPVGSGKSSLFNIILQELIPTEGTVEVRGSISYASQEPWIFTGSIQRNILFGSPYLEKKYKEVVRICSLQSDLDSFQDSDLTIVGERGAVLSGGQKVRISLARAIYKESDIYLLDDPFSALDVKVANEIFNNCINSYLKDKICVLILNQHQYLEKAKEIILLSKGHIKAKGLYNELKSEILNFASLNENNAVVQKQHRQSGDKSILNISNGKIKDDNKKGGLQISEEQRHSGKVTWSTYKAYFQACGSILLVVFVFSLFVLAQLFASSSDYFLKYWVNLEQQMGQENKTQDLENEDPLNYSRSFCVYTYAAITVTTIIVTLTSCFVFYTTSTRGSSRLHEAMFNSIMKSTMRFFTLNSAGRILNRFSKDIETVDVIMPYALINCMQTILSIIGVVTIVAIINPWLIIPTFFAFCLLNVLRSVYLAVSNNIKRLQNTTRSPVLNYVTTTLQGLTTIRAYKAQIRLQEDFDHIQDIHTSARFLNVAATRMFAVWLEIICAIYFTLVVFSFLVFGNEYGGNIGLAITQVMSMMGSIQWGVRQSSELENHMTSVERVIEYRDHDDKEQSEAIVETSPEWPAKGRIEFCNVYLSYGLEDPPILKNLNFVIEPRQKIGIIGRTGSGKSSIINALFRLSHTEGSIFIDNVNTKQITLEDLRSRISIIPQEPILFTGSIRKNLDPFDEYDDYILWKTLKEVNMSDGTILDEGLDTKITENGSNFSVGQKQLICLARAIIRNNKILVLDEATSNIDPETDELIQKTVRNKFSDCTVLTVAHRMETVMDSGKILSMEDGEIREFDHPYLLLQNKTSYLSKMMLECGDALSAQFLAIAKKNFENAESSKS